MSLIQDLEGVGLGLSKGQDGAIKAYPLDAEEVQALVRTCRRAKEHVLLEIDGLPPTPLWAPQEGMAFSSADEETRVCVDLGKMKAVALDRESHLVNAFAGISVSDLEEYVSEHGFTLGLQDPPALAVGAWLALNEPGPGSRLAFPGWSPVAAVEAVLLEGSLIRTSRVPRSATGPDPKALLIGGKGRLGVITRVTLRMYPAARGKRIVMAFADAADAVGAVIEALGQDLVPDAFGLLDGGISESVLAWEVRGDPGRVARVSLAIDEVAALNGGRRLASIVREPGAQGEMLKEPEVPGLGDLGAAGPVEVRAAAARRAGRRPEPSVAIGFGARWSRIVLVRRALINELGGSVRLHLEKALPEGGMGIACVDSENSPRARDIIRQAGGFPVGDEESESWIEGVAGTLLGEAP